MKSVTANYIPKNKQIRSGLIGQTGSGGRHRNGRRRAVALAATRVDSTSSDEFEASNDAKSGSNGGSRRYPTLRRRNSRDLLNNDAMKTTVHTTTTEAICHDSNGQSKPRYPEFFRFELVKTIPNY